MGYNIQKIKDFLKNGAAQFEIIERRKSGAVFDYQLLSVDELDFGIKETLFPPSEDLGIVKKVRRISDNMLFTQGEFVEVDGIGSCIIVEFKEDLVSCRVVDFENKQKTLEINDVRANPDYILADTEGVEGYADAEDLGLDDDLDLGGEEYEL